MCGIYSIINYEYFNMDKLQLNFYKLQHRGPDNSTYNIINNNIIMGFHRLMINGLDKKSNQPLINNNIYLICNGEIYNKNELVDKYNINMSTNSDCEIILHLYKKFGISHTTELLDGEFAFCLYDGNKKLFHICRDHIGVRPLFIGKKIIQNKRIYGFASEAKGLINLFDDIQQYKPGCYSILDIDKETYKTVNWFNYNTMDLTINKNISHKYINYDKNKILKKIKKNVIKSVNDRTFLSDRPVGCFLSGGLDSSLVASIMSRTNKNVHCFSIGLVGSLDLEASKIVSSYLNLKNHHVVTFTVDEGINSIPSVIKSIESYDITTIRASIPQWLLSKYILKNTDVKVLLSGEVPDESIPGYWAFSFYKDEKEFKNMSQKMIEDLHEYDLLRTDRTTACFGLEVRVPYAQKKLLKLFQNINIKYRSFGDDKIEKSLLRDAFKGDWLPEKILYRKKHAFSDAIDGNNICFYKEIEKYANTVITKKEWDNRYKLYPNNTPISKESFYYRMIFENIYNGYDKLISKFWLPKLKNKNGTYINDPSATALPGHKIDNNIY